MFESSILIWNLNYHLVIRRYTRRTQERVFLGDGERYHEIEKVEQALNFTPTHDETFESDVKITLERIDADPDFYPHFEEGQLYFKQVQVRDGVSTIYLILNTDEKLLYVVENIF